MALGKAIIDIMANLSPLKKGLAKAAAATKKAVGGISKGAFNILSAGIKKITQIAKTATVAIIGIFTAAILLAGKQEEAELKLERALLLSGKATMENVEAYKKFATEIQKVTKYGDEEVLVLGQLLASLGVLPKDMEKATKMSIGLATALGKDVKSMAQYIALAMQGEYTMLRRYIPALRKVTTESEQLAILTEFAARGFAMAKDEVNTFKGALAQLKNTAGDTGEILGGDLKDTMTEVFKVMKTWLEGNKDLFAGWGKVANDTLLKVVGYFNELKTLVEDEGWGAAMQKIIDDMTKALAAGLEVMKTTVIPIIKDVGAKMGAALGKGILSGIKKLLANMSSQDRALVSMAAGAYIGGHFGPLGALAGAAVGGIGSAGHSIYKDVEETKKEGMDYHSRRGERKELDRRYKEAQRKWEGGRKEREDKEAKRKFQPVGSMGEER